MIAEATEKTLTKSFNLYDILPLEKNSLGKKKIDKELITDVEQQIETVKELFQLHKKYNLHQDFTEINSKLLDKIIDDINAKRKEYFLRNKKLHKSLELKLNNFNIPYRDDVIELYQTRDIYTKLSETPTVKISSIKSLADKLDMIVFPFEYLDKNSYSEESWEKTRLIKRFYSELKDDFDIVVLAPINHYSLTSHAKAEDPNKAIYAGKHSMVFTSVLMNIPMFRSILNDLEDLRENVESLNGTISNVQKNMELMQQQINNLQKQLDQQKERQLQMELKHKAEIANMSQRLSEMAFRVTDPVMFAIPKDMDVNDMHSDNQDAFVGPVWGPDFEGIALYNLDMEIYKNQRNTLNNISERQWG